MGRSLAGTAGLSATYYANSLSTGTSVTIGAGEPVSSRVHTGTIDWSATASHPTPIASLPAQQGFGVRWRGFISASLSQTYTFAVSLHDSAQSGEGAGLGHPSRIKLWIDNHLIIDQWASLTLHEPTAKVPLQARVFSDISMLYKCSSNSSSCAHSLRWSSATHTRYASLHTCS